MNVQTINIALPKNLVQAIDAAAKKEYRNRSEFIREATRVYLKDMIEWEELFTYGKKQAKERGVKTEQDIDLIVSSYRKGT